MPEIYDQLRDIIENCDESRYSISQNTGIAQSMLSSFMNRKRGLSQETIEVLLEYLGYEIVVKKKSKKRKA